MLVVQHSVNEPLRHLRNITFYAPRVLGRRNGHGGCVTRTGRDVRQRLLAKLEPTAWTPLRRSRLAIAAGQTPVSDSHWAMPLGSAAMLVTADLDDDPIRIYSTLETLNSVSPVQDPVQVPLRSAALSQDRFGGESRCRRARPTSPVVCPSTHIASAKTHLMHHALRRSRNDPRAGPRPVWRLHAREEIGSTTSLSPTAR